ncbi:MAG: NAD-dependent deacylase, partial [Leeuwenhoekiella sp.]
VPLLEEAAQKVMIADYVIIVGTSLQVYPAAGLMDFAPQHAQLYFIDPRPNIQSSVNLQVIPEKATTGIPTVVRQLLGNT